MITSGLLRAFTRQRDRRYSGTQVIPTKKALIKEFAVGGQSNCMSKGEILIPQITYLTNDSWEDISCNCIRDRMADSSSGTLFKRFTLCAYNSENLVISTICLLKC